MEAEGIETTPWKRCGVGGSVKELQGDHPTVVVEVLGADGYDVAATGG